MKKSYKIGGKKYILTSTVYSWFVYKDTFGHELEEDMSRAIALDKLRTTEQDEVTRSRLFGEECRLFLQILWTFAYNDDLPPFEDWLQGIEAVDIIDVVGTASELYAATHKPDRKNRGIGGGDGKSGSISTEELAQMLLSIGITINDMKNLTVGQAINLIYANIRAAKRARGEKVSDPDLQYRQLKEMIELIDNGTITEYDKKEYDEIKKRLKEWEDG